MNLAASVVIPAHNAEGTIAKCLTAFKTQGYPQGNLEIVVVDDGSDDGTRAIVEKFPVRYVRQAQAGPAAARNKGIETATGDIILFTDSDCVPEPNWVFEMMQPFQDDSVAAVKGAYGSRQPSIIARFAQIEFEERYAMLARHPAIDMIDTYAAGFRKAVLSDAGGFDTSFPVANNEDTELSYRLVDKGYRMVFNPKAIVYHLRHPDSVRKYMRLKFWRGYWRMVVYKKYPGKAVKDTYTPQTLKLQILFIYLSCLFLPLVPLWDPAKMLLIGSLVAFTFSALPFSIFALARDTVVGALSPFLLAMRATSIGAGVLCSIPVYLRPGKASPESGAPRSRQSHRNQIKPARKVSPENDEVK